MSWSISAVGKDAKAAKRAIRTENEKQGEHCPDSVLRLLDAAVDALPSCSLEGYDAVAVSTYGHFTPGDVQGTSNVNLSVQHVENTAAVE